jgi:cell division protein FtsI (penicillin-binding protein 3)
MTALRTASLRSRTLIFAACLVCAFLGILGRLTYLQIVKHDEYSRLAESQYAKSVALRPKRGPIVDRGGQVLAESSSVESLFALPQRIGDAGHLAGQLAPILDEPAADIARRLDPAKRFVWVKRKMSPPMAEAVRALGAPGLGFLQESLRLYPSRELASHVVGFEGLDGKGLGGVEQAWDVHLAGAEGRALVERDALGRDVTGAPAILKAPVPGQGIALTIDATLQYVAEKEIEAAWRRTGSKAAMAVMMDPRTGEILALAIRPTFNPNAFGAATDEQRRNRAITDPFEPGSTFKVIMAAAALEEGVVRPSDRFYGENGKIKVASAVISDWKPFGWLTFAEVLQNSSNVGSIKAGMQLGKERYYRYITGFGFGQPAGLGLPGESRGQLRAPPQWSALSLATMSIGQEISVTAVQIVTAFSAIANGGRLMRPQIVRAVLDGQGREVRGFEPRAVRQVISPETARELTTIMTAVVREGTGHNAAIPGYDVAGKTGTAQKMDPSTRRYSHKPGVLSFVGFAPADDPRLAMIVLLDEPKNEKWGSEAAAPIFAAIGGQALRHMNVPPRGTAPVPIIRADTAGGAQTAGAAVPVVLASLEDGSGTAGIMPALRGRSLRSAMAALAPLEVAVEIQGRGVVVAQSPAPGTPIAAGMTCQLTLTGPAEPPAASR